MKGIPVPTEVLEAMCTNGYNKRREAIAWVKGYRQAMEDIKSIEGVNTREATTTILEVRQVLGVLAGKLASLTQ